MDEDDATTTAGFGVTTSKGSGDINYFFPVTVEVRLAQPDTSAVADQVMDQLAEGLNSE